MSKAKKVRQGIRLQISNLEKKLQPMIQEKEEVNVKTLRQVILMLESQFERLNELDSRVIEEIEDDLVDEEITRTANYNERVLEMLTGAQILFEEVSAVAKKPLAGGSSRTVESQLNVSQVPDRSTVRLPKLEVPKFGGDPMTWQTFFDVFKAAVHDNAHLSDVEKFTYLLSYLEGEAFSVAKGYQLTESNYNQVMEALQERFGDPQRAMFAHFEAMLEISEASHDLSELQKVSDECDAHIRSLVALGLSEETFGIVFAPIILTKLPKFVKIELYRKNGKQKWTLENVRCLLKEEIRARELGQSNSGKKGNKEKDLRNPKRSPENRHEFKRTTTSALVAESKRSVSKTSRECLYCNSKSHFPDQCDSYPNITTRKGVLMESRSCFVCLKNGHPRLQCPMKNKVCYHCGKIGHHRSLCHSKFGPSGSQDHPGGSQLNPKARVFTPNSSKPTKAGSLVTLSENQCVADGDVAFLPTAVAKIRNSEGIMTEARLLMDSASSRSYVTEELCRKLKLQNIGTSYVSVGHFGSDKRTTGIVNRVQFEVMCSDGSVQPVVAFVKPIISCAVSRHPIDKKRFPIVESIPLGEPLPLQSKCDELPLDVLIGSDQFFNFVNTNNVITCENGPVFLGSRLGFLTAGTMKLSGAEEFQNTLVLLLTEAQTSLKEPSDNFGIERFWTVEDIGSKESQKESSDEKAKQSFKETVQFENGRYQVTWPWKEVNPVLDDNYALAKSRLKSVLARLREQPKLLQAYDKVIKEQLEKGIVEPAPEVPDGIKYYVPHHCVVNMQRSSTKIRVVYDASAKSRKDGRSLNDCLHRGPVMLDDLCGLLLRFRLPRIALVSDIEKAFLQIELKKSERDVGRFLWVLDPAMPIERTNLIELRFSRVFFGVISSPFLLAATIDMHLTQSGSSIAEKVKGNLYVDNVIIGEDTENSAIQDYQDSKQLFEAASMNLREFYTNSEKVRNSIRSEDQGSSTMPKVLGLKWDNQKDVLYCPGLKSDFIPPETGATKRSILKEVAQIFDPCGWFSPIVVNGKLLVQELWLKKLDWDTKIEDKDILSRWEAARSQLAQIKSCEIQRFVGFGQGSIQLHVFCDASAKAAAACVYLRQSGSGKDNANCVLLISKTRVAPTSPKASIPRLELLAMELGINLINFVSDQLRKKVSEKYAWTDSQCVLHWLGKDSWDSRYVANRVKKIKERSSGVEFRFVGTADNPADIPSRGTTMDKLKICREWWYGPSFLRLNVTEWPDKKLSDGKFFDVAADTEETSTSLVAVSDQVAEDPVIDPLRFSSLNKFLRVTAYVLRFGRNCRQRQNLKEQGPLKISEIGEARKYWDIFTQKQAFPSLKGEDSSKVWSKSPLKQLGIFRNDHGVLCCSGRLGESDLSSEAQTPVLLPKDHAFTRLVIQDAHEAIGHAGVSQTLFQVRQQYWVVHGRSQVKKVIRECRRCRRIEGGAFQVPKPPALPKFRVSDDYPFTYTGVDYLGPLNVKVGRKQFKKVWISLFTCASTRAVHLEVVDSQSSQDFHLALRRFMSLYGAPKIMVSDNASQFHVVDSVVKSCEKRLSDTEVSEMLLSHGIQWKFLPQVAAWMGGFYERLIGIVKRHLKKCLDGLCVTPVELSTVVAEIGSIVNSRPLLYVEDGVKSTQLCPGYFLGRLGKPRLPTYEVSTIDSPRTTQGGVLAQWKRIQGVLSNFWTLWRQAYLTGLREKHANIHQRNPSALQPAIDTVVQVKDNVPRTQWKLGRIIKLFQGRDGQVRTVELRLANGYTIVRPVRLLYPVEMHIESKAEDYTPSNEPKSNSGQDPGESEDESDNGFQGFSPADVEATRQMLASFQTKLSPIAHNSSLTNSSNTIMQKRQIKTKFLPPQPFPASMIIVSLIKICTNALIVIYCIVSFFYRIMEKYIVHVVNGHPLHMSGIHTHRLQLSPSVSVTTVKMAFNVVSLFQHNKRKEMFEILSDPTLKWQPQRQEEYMGKVLKEVSVKFLRHSENIIEAILAHFLKNPQNSFRMALEYELYQAGRSIDEIEFRVYGSTKCEPVLSSGCSYKQWSDPILCPNVYGNLLNSMARHIAEGTEPENTLLSRYLTDSGICGTAMEKSVIVVSDDPTGLWRKVKNGEVLQVPNGKYGQIRKAIEGLNTDKFEHVVVHAGAFVDLSEKYPRRIRTQELYELKDELVKIADKKVIGAVLFSSGFDSTAKEGNFDHIAEVRGVFKETKIFVTTFVDSYEKFYHDDGQKDNRWFAKNGKQLTVEGSRLMWLHWGTIIPGLRLFAYELFPAQKKNPSSNQKVGQMEKGNLCGEGTRKTFSVQRSEELAKEDDVNKANSTHLNPAHSVGTDSCDVRVVVKESDTGNCKKRRQSPRENSVDHHRGYLQGNPSCERQKRKSQEHATDRTLKSKDDTASRHSVHHSGRHSYVTAKDDGPAAEVSKSQGSGHFNVGVSHRSRGSETRVRSPDATRKSDNRYHDNSYRSVGRYSHGSGAIKSGSHQQNDKSQSGDHHNGPRSVGHRSSDQDTQGHSSDAQQIYEVTFPSEASDDERME